VKPPTHLHVVPMLRKRGAIPPLTQYVLMACCLVERRGHFTFIFCFICRKAYFIVDVRLLAFIHMGYWVTVKSWILNWACSFLNICFQFRVTSVICLHLKILHLELLLYRLSVARNGQWRVFEEERYHDCVSSICIWNATCLLIAD